MDPKDKQDVLAELRSRHDTLVAEIQPMLEARRSERETFDTRSADTDETKHPTDEERATFAEAETKFNRDLDSRLGELRTLKTRVEQEETLADSLAVAQRSSRGVSFEKLESQREPMVYRQDNQGQHSYFLDLAAHQNQEVRSVPNAKLEGYRDRLERHAKMMGDVMPDRWASRKRDAERQVENAESELRSRHRLGRGELSESPFTRQAQLESMRLQYDLQETRAPSRIVGQGGLLTLAAA
jgi:hypothetical protein